MIFPFKTISSLPKIDSPLIIPEQLTANDDFMNHEDERYMKHAPLLQVLRQPPIYLSLPNDEVIMAIYSMVNI
jgi:hypothetical protein